MYNRLDNLGDYAVVGRDLKMFDGNREALYNSIKKVGARQASTKQMLTGAAFILVGEALFILGKEGYKYYKERKKTIQKEPELKRQFSELVDEVMNKEYKRCYPVCPYSEHGPLEYLGGGDYKCSVCGMELHDYTFDGEERPFKFSDISVGDDLSEY